MELFTCREQVVVYTGKLSESLLFFEKNMRKAECLCFKALPSKCVTSCPAIVSPGVRNVTFIFVLSSLVNNFPTFRQLNSYSVGRKLSCVVNQWSVSLLILCFFLFSAFLAEEVGHELGAFVGEDAGGDFRFGMEG